MSRRYDIEDSAIIPEFGGREYQQWYDFAADMPEVYEDRLAQHLFHEALYNFDSWTDSQRAALQDSLAEYFDTEYGIDFDEMFDWESYREWYG